MTRYEVRTYNLCEGWVNCWTTYETDDSTGHPTTFATEEEAHIALLEFLAEEQAELDGGERVEEELSNPDAYWVCAVGAITSEPAPQQLSLYELKDRAAQARIKESGAL